MTVRVLILALMLLATGASAQEFSAAVPDAAPWATRFAITEGDLECSVTSGGVALCRRPGRRAWPFRISVDDGEIRRLYFLVWDGDLFLASEMEGNDAGWSQIVRVNRGKRAQSWLYEFRGFNLPPPVKSDNGLFVSASMSVARLDPSDGHYEWRVELGGETRFEPDRLELSGRTLVIHEVEGITEQTRLRCLDARTGECASCP